MVFEMVSCDFMFHWEAPILFWKFESFYHQSMLCRKTSNWDDLNVSTSCYFLFIFLNQQICIVLLPVPQCHITHYCLDIAPVFCRIKEKLSFHFPHRKSGHLDLDYCLLLFFKTQVDRKTPQSVC